MPQRKILLVDDVEFFLELERDFLNQTPGQIITARNGQEALDLVARERPNLIFLDVNMPVMDGLTCCRTLKADPFLRDIPVIMVFAPSKEVTAETCRGAGCDGLVTKPLERNAFLAAGRAFLPKVNRRDQRIACRLPVTLRWVGGEARTMSEDLGEGGIYLACQEELRHNEMVRLSIEFPGEPLPVEVRGRVAWVNQGTPRRKGQLPPGLGVHFLRPDAELRGVIGALLAADKR